MKLIVPLVTIAAVLVGQSVFADEQKRSYSDKTIKGTWTLSVSGSTTSGSILAPAGTALVAIATITFDGNGNCSSIDQILLDGQFIPSRDGFRESVGCEYAVNDDGTGFFDVEFAAAGITNCTFVIEDSKSMHFMASNQTLGIFGGGELNRQ